MMEWEAPRGSEGAVRERPLRAEARFIWQGPPRRPAGSRLPQQLLALFKNSALATWEVHPGAGQDAPTRAFPQAAHLRPTMPAALRLHAAWSSAGQRMCTALTSWPHAGLGGLANYNPAGCRIGAAPPNMAGTGRALKPGNGAGPGPGRIPPGALGGAPPNGGFGCCRWPSGAGRLKAGDCAIGLRAGDCAMCRRSRIR